MTRKKHEITFGLANTEKAIDNKVNLIKKLVAAYYGETVAIYTSRNLKREKLMIKHVAVFLCSKMVELSPGKKIGPSRVADYFGYDHATVLHIGRKLSGYIDYDRAFRLEMEKIETGINYKIQMRDNKQSLIKDYYFIDLNGSVSMKLSDTKAIVLTGFDDEEVEKIKNLFRCPVSRKHKETSMYILETQPSPSI